MVATIMLLVLGALVAAAFGVMQVPQASAQDAPGNNGTVKIHDGPDEPDPEVRNQPHVCTFHLHFFFGDDVQAGDWWIESWPPNADRGTVVLAGTYDATGGEDRDPDVGVHELPDGHYKLFWEGGTTPGGQLNIKHKVFWVDCAGGGEGELGSLTVLKTDEDGDPLDGASFVLIDAAQVEIEPTVSADGTTFVFADLEAGVYTLHESVAPDGCEPAADVTVTLPDPTQGNDVTVTAENDCAGGGEGELGSLTVLKTDEDGDPLDGASFVLIDAAQVEIEPTVSADGTTFVFADLEAGVYTLHESVAPDGCEPAADVTVTLPDPTQGNDVTVTAENDCGDVLPGEATPSPPSGEDVLGGTPAPGGQVPDTAADESNALPASILGLLLLSSIGTMVYLRFAADPARRR
jgi:hypothetical protein